MAGRDPGSTPGMGDSKVSFFVFALFSLYPSPPYFLFSYFTIQTGLDGHCASKLYSVKYVVCMAYRIISWACTGIACVNNTSGTHHSLHPRDCELTDNCYEGMLIPLHLICICTGRNCNLTLSLRTELLFQSLKKVTIFQRSCLSAVSPT